jgi:hypothetical protein
LKEQKAGASKTKPNSKKAIYFAFLDGNVYNFFFLLLKARSG